MISLIESLKQILGEPNFYLESGQIDYGNVTLYLIAGVVLCIVVAGVFKLVRSAFK